MYFNVLVLQQQHTVLLSALPKPANGEGLAVSTAAWRASWRNWMCAPPEHEKAAAEVQRRTWRYWLERCAAVLGHGPPTGLYNNAVRARFRAMMQEEGSGRGAVCS